MTVRKASMGGRLTWHHVHYWAFFQIPNDGPVTTLWFPPTIRELWEYLFGGLETIGQVCQFIRRVMDTHGNTDERTWPLERLTAERLRIFEDATIAA